MHADLVFALDTAITFARAGIEALPDKISIEDECAAIDAMSASANGLAEIILAGSHDQIARAKAEAWLNGTLHQNSQAAMAGRLRFVASKCNLYRRVQRRVILKPPSN
jgi:hypothetical protein